MPCAQPSRVTSICPTARNILAHTDFKPIVDHPQETDSRILRDEPIDLKNKLLSIKLRDRFTYDPSRETLFMRSDGHSEEVANGAEQISSPMTGRPVSPTCTPP